MLCDDIDIQMTVTLVLHLGFGVVLAFDFLKNDAKRHVPSEKQLRYR